MTQEEKARAYDEAIKRAKDLNADNMLSDDAIDEIFPELRESEDERIRKRIYGLIYHNDALLDKEELLAWLEKQKEQKLHLTVSGKEVYKICPRCKSRMIRDDSKVYTSMPPQYGYECPKCGETEFDTVKYDNPEMEEQKLAEWAELQSEFRNINEAFEDGKKEVVGNPKKYGLQKPAEWSEEDEVYLQDALWCVKQAEKSCKDEEDKGACWSAERWLKSLRPSWKPGEINPEEIRLLDTTISFLKDFADKGYENAFECIDWLKSKRNGTARK